jgi:hypothetical protein
MKKLLLALSLLLAIPVFAQSLVGNYKYISTATTTTVLAQSGYLYSITINGGTAGVVTLFDVTGASCTGTPGSGKFATIETIGSTNPVTLTYNTRVNSGICVVTAAATDLTVTFAN